MITLETLLKDLTPASLNEIVAGFDRGGNVGGSSGMEGRGSKSGKVKSSKSSKVKSSKSHKSHKSHKSGCSLRQAALLG